MHRRVFFPVCAAVLALHATTAWAWPGTEVFPGVTYEHRSGPQDYGSGDYPQEIYIAYVDTSHPSVSFIATKPSQRGLVVSEFAAAAGAAVAVNTNFYGGGFQPCGMVMGDGELWTDAYQGAGEGSCSHTVAVGPGNDVSFHDTWGIPNGPAPSGAHEVATGMPTLVRGGAIVDEAELEGASYPDHMATAQPRTAICLHEDGHTMILAVVDGREAGVRTGMRAITLARFMKGLGCRDAVNLDGGGSTTMFVEGQAPYPGRPTGVVNRTSDGQERAVCCHLGVRIDPDPPPVDAGAEAAAEGGVDASGLDASAGDVFVPDAVGPDDASDSPVADSGNVDAGTGADGSAGAGGAAPGAAWTNDEASGCACRAAPGRLESRIAWLAALVVLGLARHRGRRTRTRRPVHQP